MDYAELEAAAEAFHPPQVPQIIVAGPTVRGTFFIHDTTGSIWDGAAWRGFGEAQDYPDFNSAFRARAKAKRHQFSN